MMKLADLLAQYSGQPAPQPPSLTDRLGIGRTVVAPEFTIVSPTTLNEKLAARRRGPEHTDELLRIKDLPRRPRPSEEKMEELQRKWDARLRIDSDVAPCGCADKWGFCIKHLNEIQAWACEECEAGESDDLGEVCKIGVGSGKTGLDALLAMTRPGVRNVLLLLKASLIDQFIEVDYPQWSAHFRTPNLDARFSKVINPGRPMLHVYSYSALSQSSNTDLLGGRLQPDMIIADECQNLGNAKSSRTIRFMRYLEAHPECIYIPLSGSLNSKGVSNNGHQYGMALGERSPMPLNPETQKRWGRVLDQDDENPWNRAGRMPMGALEVFCKPGEDVVEAVGRRVNETKGVISSVELSCKMPLEIRTRHALDMPKELAEAMAKTRATGARPDGEEAQTSFQKALWLREMACGFFYRYRFPRGEPEELILDWFAAKKNWNKELRDTIGEDSPENMDSVKLLTNAAERHYRNYKGKLPTWQSLMYPRWRQLKDKVEPMQSIVWLDDHLLNDAVAWAEERKAAGEGGIIWCEFTEIGQRIAKRLGVPYYNGQQWGAEVRKEKGDRVIVCSIRGFGTGMNLQRFRRHLVTSNPASAEIWQQLLGRAHRQGQDRGVIFEVYRHTPELRGALEKALERSDWIERFDKEEMKMCFARRDW